MVCFCGKLALPWGLIDGCIEMIEGRISSLSVGMRGCEGVDLILPGMVDLHVHMRGLNQRHKGDWRSESLAALSGGVTVVADMPNNVPKIDSKENLEIKLEEAKRESYVDFLLYTAFPYLDERSYVIGIKIYPEDMYEDLNIVFKRASEIGKEVVVHAEDPLILKEAERVFDVKEHNRARPELAERVAVDRVISLARRHRAKLRIAHSTLPYTLAAVSEARAEGIEVTAEVTPHHLLYSSSDAESLGSLFKVNPPIRDTREKLLGMVRVGFADFLVTDHAPHSPEEKSKGYEEMPSGIPWLDAFTPFLIQCVEEGELPYRVLSMYSLGPASHLGLRRGSLIPGNLADLVILKRERWTLKKEDLYTKARASPIEGKELKWKVSKVFIRGELVFHDGPVVSAGFGVPAL
mgnify:CR=1 FL=1